MTTTLYGIKNCDTVKKARKWLEENTIDYTFHDFRVDGINADMITGWLQQQPVEKLVNKRSTTWKQLSDDDKNNLSDTSAISLCVAHETLVKRPVLDHNGDIHLGFKAADYTAIFGK
ncbi:putative protein [BD1-7 clade bacterium]|uniref:Protein YffB n=1 Tax=BD1-7 clade bacterium TaxID=2029982 RepID=A0A5S9QBJ0_9GAMM|nr:putative protein [BD1-7 clade bacterium]CAA0115560.1 putative protein [BD1-7 clade bacterium]CAA0119272.1 putative protein [BD1-7 clade bacterium]